MSNAAVDSFLEHHGVKGMKWGVRRAEGSSGADRKAAKKAARAAKGPSSKTTYFLTGRMGSKDAFQNPEARALRVKAGHARAVAIISGVAGVAAGQLGPKGELAAFVLSGTSIVTGLNSQIGAFKAIDLEQKSRQG